MKIKEDEILDDCEMLRSPIKSLNLRNCYERYQDLRHRSEGKLEDGPSIIQKELAGCDVAMWMSGLLCGANPDCNTEVSLIAPNLRDRRVPFFLVEKKLSPSETDSSKKDCLPGCGCDNPWSFLTKS